MKISTRLSFSFSLIASAIFIAFAVIILLFSSNYRKNDFQERLKQRVIITEKIFLEKNTFSPEALKKINNQFLHTLPEETEEVVLVKNTSSILKHNYPPEIKKELAAFKAIDFQEGRVQGTSKLFRVNGEDYLVIVSAVDQVGLQNLSFLRKIISLLIIIGIPLIFLGSFIFTNRALLPISKKIDKANSISASNLNQRLNVHNPDDELGKMAIAFNKLLDRLEISFESQKAFIRNASHEIRNPLTAIMGEAEVAISKSRTNEEYIASLNVVINEAEVLNSTVNNLLQLSKINATDEIISHEIIKVDEFLDELQSNFDFINPDNQVHMDIDKKNSKEGFTISANKNLLKSAIINLLDNACKFSLNEKVSVKLSSKDNEILLSVQDSGIGIQEDDLPKIMTPFYRGNNAIKVKGSGIGLSLCSKIITLHKGTIDVKSNINTGTTILVKIPLLSRIN